MKQFLSGLNPKLKNPYFWLSLVGVLFAAGGIDLNSLTSWSLLGQAVMGILGNPVAIIACVTAVLGIYNDNSTKGIDKAKIYSDDHRDI